MRLHWVSAPSIDESGLTEGRPGGQPGLSKAQWQITSYCCLRHVSQTGES